MATFSERLARVERERSASAEWCQLFSFFAVPFFIIVVVGHRSGLLQTQSTFWLVGIGLIVLIASLVFGIRGFYELWSKGKIGGLKSAKGMAVALLLLTPFVYNGFLAFALPPLHDISTDLEIPPDYENALVERTDAMNEIVDPGEVQSALQLRTYPKVSARRYPLGAGRVFKAAAALVNDNDWRILSDQTQDGFAPIDQEGSALVAPKRLDSKGRPLVVPKPAFRPKFSASARSSVAFETVEILPTGRQDDDQESGELDERYIEAVAKSFLFGFESDVIIRIIEEEDGTLVDVRSNSRWGPHDLGANAHRIIDFMSDLDSSLQGLGKDS